MCAQIFFALLLLTSLRFLASEYPQAPIDVIIKDTIFELSIKPFQVMYGAIEQFKDVAVCVKNSNASEAHFIINRGNVTSLKYIKDIVLLTQKLFEAEQNKPEITPELVSWEDRDMLEYITLADE